MDILCVGMPRSCSTWQYEVACHLIKSGPGGVRLGYLEGDEYARLLADEPPEVEGRFRVVKAHRRHAIFEERLSQGKALALYSSRDVRDVAFSLAYKLGLGFETLHESGRLADLLVDDRFWRGRQGVLDQRYEDIVVRPVSSVRSLAEHIGFTISAAEAGHIASQFSFESNLRRTETLRLRLLANGVDLQDPNNLLRHDSATLLHWNHLRAGRIGGWRDESTPAQRKILAELFNPWLAENGYEPDETLYADGLGHDLREGVQGVRQHLRTLTRTRRGLVANRFSRIRERAVSKLPRPIGRWLAALFT